MTLPAFSFMTATEIFFGRGQAAHAAARVAALGKRVLLVHGATPARADWLCSALEAMGAGVGRFAVPHEPDMALVEAGLAQARDQQAEVIVALGGGAVIDAGKAIASLVPAPRPMRDHLEVVGKGLPLDAAPLPFVAMPTTAGTGAEVTRNAVIAVPEERRKVSLRDPRMLPRIAIVDPALTDLCPRGVTLASGLDAITQVIEPYVSTRANAFTDALCRDAISRGLSALRRLMEAEDPAARDEIAWVSLAGGVALANAGLGAVHGLASPLGGLSNAPHGAICGVLLPHVLLANWLAVADISAAARLDEVGRWIASALGAESSDLAAACKTLADWSRAAGLPSLTELGITAEDRAEAAVAAATSSSMKANPATLTATTLAEVMAAAA